MLVVVNDIGLMLDRVRMARGFDTDAELAPILGASRQAISGWRNGKSIKPSNLSRLHTAYREAQRELSYRRADVDDLRRRAKSAIDTLGEDDLRDLTETLEALALEQLKRNLGEVTPPVEGSELVRLTDGAIVGAADDADADKDAAGKRRRSG